MAKETHCGIKTGPAPLSRSYVCYNKKNNPGHSNKSLGPYGLAFNCSRCENWWCNICYRDANKDRADERCPKCGPVQTEEQISAHEWFPPNPKFSLSTQTTQPVQQQVQVLQPSSPPAPPSLEPSHMLPEHSPINIFFDPKEPVPDPGPSSQPRSQLGFSVDSLLAQNDMVVCRKRHFEELIEKVDFLENEVKKLRSQIDVVEKIRQIINGGH